jgi:hypothetical protein
LGGYDNNYHKFHAEFGMLGVFRFGLCYCRHSRANASGAGVDEKRARVTVRDAWDRIIAGTVPAGTDPGAWLCANPTIAC